MRRSSKAHWNGDLSTGHGELTTDSLVLNKTRYSFNTRFADGIGTNPEELLAAAHAGCFTMALSYALSQAGLKVADLDTTAVVIADMSKSSITDIELTLDASPIEGLSEEGFLEYAIGAKQNCLLSKALAGVVISLQVNYKDLHQHIDGNAKSVDHVS
ncbi:osmotically inducible protein OsmC [Chitinophaga sp. YR627]|uniref:OsmC family peroxiredoxin n=1 Tax=Chitinophaga sp. YR627 TaxID=1881041 RepID=UPI0008E9D9F8|nr:OsmC family peroxiredoxin [Chitinophaga sp. YR627]SFO21117.1 osmotically inducible protein OsmC [Chitinophaga sp. YR627]